MACRIFPNLTDDDLQGLSSQAEAKFYKACRLQLPSNFLVLHSLSMVFEQSKSGRKGVGESDFVIFNPRSGILVVEVKGGGVKYNPKDSSHWMSVDRVGNEHVIKNPFEQAKNYQFKILDLVKSQVRGMKSTHFPLGHSVAFPDLKANQLKSLISHDRPRDVIACGDDLYDLLAWYEKASTFWSGKRETEPIGAQAIKEIEKVFLKPVYARPTILSKIEDEEDSRIKLTDEQARLLFSLEVHDRVNISGGAGTGKTVLAKKLAEKFSLDGRKTALLCYNKGLGEELASAYSNDELISAATFHSFVKKLLGEVFEKYLAEAREAYPNSDDWKVIIPFAAVMALEDDSISKFEAVIIDEGQDFSPEMWLVVDMLLANDDSKLFVFSDTHQGLYSKQNHVPKLSPPFLLFTNCRNTKRIHELAYSRYEGPPILPPKIEGEKVKKICEKSLKAQKDYILSMLDKLIFEEKLKPDDITILIAKSTDFAGHFEQLLQANSTHRFAQQEFKEEHTIRVSTIKRFKGLESSALIIWGLDDLPEHESKELSYVGISRAKSLCYLVN